MRSWVGPQNGFRDELPHRHRSYSAVRVGIGSSGAQSTGSPYSVSTWAVRTSGTPPWTRYGPFSMISTRGVPFSSGMGATLRRRHRSIGGGAYTEPAVGSLGAVAAPKRPRGRGHRGWARNTPRPFLARGARGRDRRKGSGDGGPRTLDGGQHRPVGLGAGRRHHRVRRGRLRDRADRAGHPAPAPCGPQAARGADPCAPGRERAPAYAAQPAEHRAHPRGRARSAGARATRGESASCRCAGSGCTGPGAPPGPARLEVVTPARPARDTRSHQQSEGRRMARPHRLIPGLLLLVLVACTSIPYRPAPTSPSPVVSTDDRLIVLGDDGNLRSMAPDGSNVVPFTTDAGPDVQIDQPVASPDGRYVAWVEIRNGQPSVVTAARSGQRLQTVPMGIAPFFLQWDPTSTNIAYLGNAPQGLGMGVIERAAAAPDDVAVGGGSPFYLSWSPDGSKLLVHVGGTQLGVTDVHH